MGNRQPNTRLRLLLDETGWTYGQFARRVNAVGTETGTPLRYDESAVSHWLNGTMPRKAVRQCVLEALARKLARNVTHTDAGFPAPCGPAVARGDTVDSLIELGRLDLDIGRRRALAATAYSVAALAVPGATWWTSQAANAASRDPKSKIKVGRRDLQAVRDMASMFSRIDQRHGGGHARTAVVQYLTSDVSSYLHGRFSDDSIRRDMLSVASELTYLVGWMAFDNAEHALAQRFFTTAVTLAAEAEDAPMAAHVLRAMAHQAVDLGHPRQALDLATASVDGDRYGLATPRERALLGVVHARALAASKQPKAAASALIRAGDDLSAATSGDDEPGRVFFFSEASLAHETACTLRDLGDLDGSRREFHRSVRTRKSASFTRTHAVTLGYLGSVQARQGAIEEACATWSQALDAMEGIHSARARRTATDMRRSLVPVRNRGIAAVTELDRRAATYLAESA